MPSAADKFESLSDITFRRLLPPGGTYEHTQSVSNDQFSANHLGPACDYSKSTAIHDPLKGTIPSRTKLVDHRVGIGVLQYCDDLHATYPY